jgi:antitoxin ParD1/3/4
VTGVTGLATEGLITVIKKLHARPMISAGLGQPLETFVEQLVVTGRYGSKSEVLREGVRLVQDPEARPNALRALIGAAIAEVDADLTRDADDVFNQLEARYRQKATADR